MTRNSNIYAKEHAETLAFLVDFVGQIILGTNLVEFGNDFQDYFSYYDEYLANTENTEFVDEQWEDILFKSLFLRNSSFNIDAKNVDFLLNYVKSRFTPGDPLFLTAIIKLGFFHEIFESEFFLNNPI